MAASATFALEAGGWFRRGRLLTVSFVRGAHRRYQAELHISPGSGLPCPLLDRAAARIGPGILVVSDRVGKNGRGEESDHGSYRRDGREQSGDGKLVD
jgi:hypothetical protein